MSATVNEGSDTALDPVYRASEVIFGLPGHELTVPSAAN
jgi:hypothetical protein